MSRFHCCQVHVNVHISTKYDNMDNSIIDIVVFQDELPTRVAQCLGLRSGVFYKLSVTGERMYAEYWLTTYVEADQEKFG